MTSVGLVDHFQQCINDEHEVTMGNVRLALEDQTTSQHLYIELYFCVKTLKTCWSWGWRESLQLIVLAGPAEDPGFYGYI